MNKEDDGGAAFPREGIIPSRGNDYTVAQQGMSLRDFFAAMAMAALTSKSEDSEIDIARIAKVAYKLADEMLRSRKD